MSLLPLTMWIFMLEQAASQSGGVNISDSAAADRISSDVIVFDKTENKEQCTLEYKEFRNSYLQFVKSPNYTNYHTSYEGCFRECCFSEKFSCKSFSYFPDTKQCFLMNVTQHDDGIVLANSQIHIHVEVIDSDIVTITEAEKWTSSSTSSMTTTTEFSSAPTARTITLSKQSTPKVTVGNRSGINITDPQLFGDNTRDFHIQHSTAPNIPTTIDSNSDIFSATTSSLGNVVKSLVSSSHGRRASSLTTIADDAPTTAKSLTENLLKSTSTPRATRSPSTRESSSVIHDFMTSKTSTRKPRLSFLQSTLVQFESTTSLGASNSTIQSPHATSTTTALTRASEDDSMEEKKAVVNSTPFGQNPTSSTLIIPTSKTNNPNSFTKSSQYRQVSTPTQQATSTLMTAQQSQHPVELPEHETSRITPLRYITSSQIVYRSTATTRPLETKRTIRTTTQQIKTSSKLSENLQIVTRFIMKSGGKTNILKNSKQGRNDKLTSCGLICENGGTCKIIRNVARIPTCICTTGFQGKLCEERLVTSKQGISRISWWIILVIIVAVILFISVVGTFLIFYIYKRKVGNYNLEKDRRFELASVYAPDRVDHALGTSYASVPWQNRPMQPLRTPDDANKSWIFCYFDDERRCESMYRMRSST